MFTFLLTTLYLQKYWYEFIMPMLYVFLIKVLSMHINENRPQKHWCHGKGMRKLEEQFDKMNDLWEVLICQWQSNDGLSLLDHPKFLVCNCPKSRYVFEALHIPWTMTCKLLHQSFSQTKKRNIWSFLCVKILNTCRNLFF